MVAVPAPAVNVKLPGGEPPVSVIVGSGRPLVVTVKVVAVPTGKVAALALVKVGGVGGATVSCSVVPEIPTNVLFPGTNTAEMACRPTLGAVWVYVYEAVVVVDADGVVTVTTGVCPEMKS
jgi:hypothetical protein